MSQLTFAQVLEAVHTFSPAELAKLRQLVNQPNGKPQAEAPTPATVQARAADNEIDEAEVARRIAADQQWLAENSDAYAGQWVALRHGQLINQGTNAKEVLAAARAKGYDDAVPVFVTPHRTQPVFVEMRDFSADNQWLSDNRSEYAGQWVALWEGRLLHHSVNAKEVFAAADAAGHPDALVVFVEPLRDHPFINIG